MKIKIAMLVFATIFTLGCGEGSPVSPSTNARKKKANQFAAQAMSASNMHQMHVAIMAFQVDAGSNRGVKSGKFGYPLGLDDLLPYLGNNASIFENPRTGDNPGYEYVPPVEKSPSTPLIYELRDGKRDPQGQVLYLDGSVSKAKPAGVTLPNP